MEMKTYRIWNTMETRRLPSGQRFVEAMVGRKWVWVRLRFDHLKNRKKIHRRVWDSIVMEERTS